WQPDSTPGGHSAAERCKPSTLIRKLAGKSQQRRRRYKILSQGDADEERRATELLPSETSQRRMRSIAKEFINELPTQGTRVHGLRPSRHRPAAPCWQTKPRNEPVFRPGAATRVTAGNAQASRRTPRPGRAGIAPALSA